ncbi:MAG: hypothetical protein RIQ79_1230, partial [Verrucomicrobiota bacterium]
PAALQLAKDVASGVVPATEDRRRQASEMAASFQAQKVWVTAR